MERFHALVAIAIAVVIVLRCIRVIHNMDLHNRSVPYLHWAAFGISYAVLCLAALGSAVHIAGGHGIPGDWLWLFSSAGLIVFDRRTKREKTIKLFSVDIFKFKG